MTTYKQLIDREVRKVQKWEAKKREDYAFLTDEQFANLLSVARFDLKMKEWVAQMALKELESQDRARARREI